MTLFGDDLPHRSGAEAMLYLLGPGVGESVVLALPDERFVVVDVCKQGTTNLPLSLLEHLGAPKLDLLVVTHPDLDHVRGLEEILQKRPPTELWRYPMEADVRAVISRWTKNHGEVAEALRAMDSFLQGPGEAFTAMYDNRVWRPESGGFCLSALAPTEYDKERASRVLMRLLSKKPKALQDWLQRVAGGAAAGDCPNVLSVALVLELGGQRVLLGGDVLKGTRSPKSGWKGILRLLQKHKRERLIQDLAAVKVAHHGSKGAFEPSAWNLHGRPAALIAPFTRSNLPDRATIANLKPFARSLMVTSSSTATEGFASAGGWSAPTGSRLVASAAPVVALRIDPAKGITEVAVGPQAIAFH